MTKKNEPLDLVGRAAARLSLDESDERKASIKGDSGVQAPVRAQAARPAESISRDPPPAPAPSPAPRLNGPAGPPAGANGAYVELDYVALKKDGYLVPENQVSRITEEFRLIKRPLLRIAFDSRATQTGIGHVIMVTSTHPEDGKTFITTNLAISMASEHDLFVLAIDADIRRMGLSRRFGVADRPGIMDVLLNPNVSIADVMVRTNIPNLAVIPAGKAIEGTTELFASQRMAKLVADVASRYKDRIIIFDTPPVLAASEASVLAAHVGQTVFVVNSGETSKRSIAEALRLIGVCPHVHFVVNRIMQASGDDRFGYYPY